MPSATRKRSRNQMDDSKLGRERKKKCVICVLKKYDNNFSIEPKEKDDDKISLYIYDKKTYRSKIWRKHRKHTVQYVNPIASINRAHTAAGYITFGSHFFRIGGVGMNSDEVKKLEEELMARGLRHMAADGYAHELAHELAQIKGEESATRTVDIIDLNSEDDRMVAKKGPEMKTPRLSPHLLILQGNLYVACGYLDNDTRYIEDLVFMEVLNKSAAAISDWFWEPVPNPPPFCVKYNFNRPRRDVITGAVESLGVIIVGFLKLGNFDGEYCFYAYRPRTRTWELSATYSNMTIVRPLKDPLCMRAAVVSGKFMLWLPKHGNHLTLLYVMDLENSELITIDLFKKKLLPEYAACPILLKLKEGKFCVFWIDSDGPRYFSGPQTYVGLHAYTFTLKTRIGRKKGRLYVKRKRRYFSLIPDWDTHWLEEICIVDVPDSKRHNKQQWTPFCRSHDSCH